MSLNGLFAGIILSMILNGSITNLPQQVDETAVNQLSAVMKLENGDNGDRCLLLTGSVVINRKNSPKWKGDTIEEVILAKEGPYWQYASKTRNNFKTTEANDHIKLLAKYLLIYGPVCPENVVYQSQIASNGSKLYEKIATPDGYEYFAYE
jgi:hypothetical protein